MCLDGFSTSPVANEEMRRGPVTMGWLTSIHSLFICRIRGRWALLVDGLAAGRRVACPCMVKPPTSATAPSVCVIPLHDCVPQLPRLLFVSLQLLRSLPSRHPGISSLDVRCMIHHCALHSPDDRTITFAVEVKSKFHHVPIAVTLLIDVSASTDLPCSRVPGA